MHAEALLKQMEEQNKMGYRNVKPNSVTFNSIIAAWEKVEIQMLECMQRPC
jgi:hypothetical protein